MCGYHGVENDGERGRLIETVTVKGQQVRDASPNPKARAPRVKKRDDGKCASGRKARRGGLAGKDGNEGYKMEGREVIRWTETKDQEDMGCWRQKGRHRSMSCRCKCKCRVGWLARCGNRA